MDESKNEDLIKLNSNKEMTVNVESIEDLLNSIKYATQKLNEAKEVAESKDLLHNISSVKGSMDLLIGRLDNLADNEVPKLKKEVSEVGKKLPSDGMLKSLHYELEKIGGIDESFKKLRGWHIVLTSIITAIVITGSLSFAKYDDELIRAIHLNQVQKQNWVLSRTKYKLESNKNGIAKFKKIK